MIGAILVIAILGYYANSYVENVNKYATCKVQDNGRASTPKATDAIPNRTDLN